MAEDVVDFNIDDIWKTEDAKWVPVMELALVHVAKEEVLKLGDLGAT